MFQVLVPRNDPSPPLPLSPPSPRHRHRRRRSLTWTFLHSFPSSLHQSRHLYPFSAHRFSSIDVRLCCPIRSTPTSGPRGVESCLERSVQRMVSTELRIATVPYTYHSIGSTLTSRQKRRNGTSPPHPRRVLKRPLLAMRHRAIVPVATPLKSAMQRTQMPTTLPPRQARPTSRWLNACRLKRPNTVAHQTTTMAARVSKASNSSRMTTINSLLVRRRVVEGCSASC